MAVYQLCRALAGLGHQLTVYTNGMDRSDRIELQDGIRVCRYGSWISYGSENFTPTILYRPNIDDADIINIHSGISMAFFSGARHARKKNKPLVVTWHGDSVRAPEMNRYTGLIPGSAAFFYRYQAMMVLRLAQQIISVSRDYIEKSQFLPLFRDKIAVIPNGVQLEQFAQVPDREECKKLLGLEGKSVILFLGSLYPIKGPDLLLSALPRLIDDHRELLAVFAGGGDVEQYRQMADGLGIIDNTRFTGYISEQKALYYRAADVFVLPSRSECFPLVVLEAMASGVPIVASDTGGVREIVKDGWNGLLTPVEEIDQLSVTIKRLLTDQDLSQRISKNAQQTIQNYSWQKIAAQTESLYQRLIMNC